MLPMLLNHFGFAPINGLPSAMTRNTMLLGALHSAPSNLQQMFADPQFGSVQNGVLNDFSASTPDAGVIAGTALLAMTLAFLLGYTGALRGGHESSDEALRQLQVAKLFNLPAVEELRGACHLIGKRGGEYCSICTMTDQTRDWEQSTFDDSLGSCEISDEFSKYYGEPIFICKRPEA